MYIEASDRRFSLLKINQLHGRWGQGFLNVVRRAVYRLCDSPAHPSGPFQKPVLFSSWKARGAAMSSVNTLANLDRVRIALAKARTLPEVKKIRDIAEAARVYAKAAHMSKESLDYAAELKLSAERKAGRILARLQKSSGGRPEKTAASYAGVSEYQKTLEETDTPTRTARYWQEVAAIPEETVRSYVTKAKLDDKNPVTTSGLIRFHDRLTKPEIFTEQENETKKRLLWLDAELTRLRDGNQSFFQFPPHTISLGGDRQARYRMTIDFSCLEDTEHLIDVLRKGLL